MKRQIDELLRLLLHYCVYVEDLISALNPRLQTGLAKKGLFRWHDLLKLWENGPRNRQCLDAHSLIVTSNIDEMDERLRS